jgi:hypothetical protein
MERVLQVWELELSTVSITVSSYIH